MATYWATQVDYDLAKKSKPNANVQLYTPGAQMGSGDYFLGGSAVLGDDALGGATRLGGANRNETNALFNQQVYKDQENDYFSKLNAITQKKLDAEAEARRNALTGAFQTNQQALGSQQSTVGNNYQSLVNQLNTTQANMLPQYQQQRNAASADAASQLKRTQALNALTGNYTSGSNRSQQLAVDLARGNAIQGITQGENQFTSDISNKLTDAEAQRVAALNDIAEKLRLNEQQYSSGTLSLEKQLASEMAASTLQDQLSAMKWAEDRAAQEAQAQYDQDLFEYKKQQDAAEWDYKNKALAQDRELTMAGLNAKSSGSSTPSVTQQKYQDEQNSKQAFASAMQGLEGLANGSATGTRYTRSQILNFIINNAADFAANGVDVQQLFDWADNKYTWEG